MNRFVRKGEKGITILAPYIYKPKKREQQQEEGIEHERNRNTMRIPEALELIRGLSTRAPPARCIPHLLII